MRSHNQAPGAETNWRERLRSGATRLLGRMMIGSNTQPAVVVREQAPAPRYTVDPSQYWAETGGKGDWRVDPYDRGRVTLQQATAPAGAHTAPAAPARERAPQAKPSAVQPYKVQGEGGVPRFETREEQANRMARFRLQHPTANAHETSFFEYSGQLPPGSELKPSGLYAQHAPEDMSGLSGYRMTGPAPAPAIGASRAPEHMVTEHVTADLSGTPLVHGGEPAAVTPNFVPLEAAHPHAVPVDLHMAAGPQ